MELLLLILVCIHKSYIVYLEIYVVPIGHGFSFFWSWKSHGKSMLKKGCTLSCCLLARILVICYLLVVYYSVTARKFYLLSCGRSISAGWTSSEKRSWFNCVTAKDIARLQSGQIIIVQQISPVDAAVRFLHCCLSAAMSFSVIRCLPAVFHTLLHRLVVGPLQYSPSILTSAPARSSMSSILWLFAISASAQAERAARIGTLPNAA